MQACNPLLLLPSICRPRRRPNAFPPQTELGQLRDLGQCAAREDAQPLVLTALASLCQEAVTAAQQVGAGG